MQQDTQIKHLSLNDTNVLKGLAIVLMLVHHVFYIKNSNNSMLFYFL